MAKVVIIDNFNRDNVSDHLLLSDLSDEEAKRIADERNAQSDPHSASYFVVKPDDYVLYKWEP